jgi:hypothetical protein
MTRKVVQVACGAPNNKSGFESFYVALCDDGTVWTLWDSGAWTQLPDIPQPAPATPAE